MGRSHDIATSTHGDTRYVNATGDGMTGNLGVGGAANGSYAITSHSSGGQNLRFENDNEYAFFRLQDNGDLQIWAHGDDNINFMNGTGSGTTRMNIDGSGRVTMTSQPHIFGTPHSGTEGSSGIASIFQVKTSRGLSFSNSRVTVPVAGVYTMTYQTICQTDTGRHDTHIRVNGSQVSNGLNESNGSGYHMRTHVINMYLNANDYIQWENARYYSNGSAFDGWTNASVTLLG